MVFKELDLSIIYMLKKLRNKVDRISTDKETVAREM